MSLECLNNIITDELAINIDLTNNKSWSNFNSDLNLISLNKLNTSTSDNINLLDFGLTEFDNGRTNIMWSGITLTPNDNIFSMYKVGYNEILNPTTGETSGITVTTHYLPLTGITSTTGNYFNLNGGYLQGFFKLEDYNYELLPSRYNYGITIETILKLDSNSHGIFYMMGVRAEDKYNPYFSGETITGTTTKGVVSSENNFLNALVGKEVNKSGFKHPEEKTEIIDTQSPQVDNIKNNAIAFELTEDKKIKYKYIDDNGYIVSDTSSSIITETGFTIISIVYTPNNIINDLSIINCVKQRLGKIIFYVNGRAIWVIKDFPEFYFHGFYNQKEKQIGVPYSISWGGGSFGLKNSYHYNYQTYSLYTNQDTNYIKNNFSVQENPLSGNTLLTGLNLSADTSTFDMAVFRIENTGSTGNTYFIKFNNPISVISNRDYVVNVSIFDDEFFKPVTISGGSVNNRIEILPFSDTIDISIINDIEYVYPTLYKNKIEVEKLGLHPFEDQQEYEYIYLNGLEYYGVSGVPVVDVFGNLSNYGYSFESKLSGNTNQFKLITGQGQWNDLKNTFRIPDNTGQHFVYIGLLIKTSDTLNFNKPLYIKDFTYTASDILVQDARKNNLIIQQNFDIPFIGGIQKLRVYNKALTSPEILYNGLIESKLNPNIKVNKGGRIINR